MSTHDKAKSIADAISAAVVTHGIRATARELGARGFRISPGSLSDKCRRKWADAWTLSEVSNIARLFGGELRLTLPDGIKSAALGPWGIKP